MRTLVTGGAGFIGSHLVEALVERGHEVRVVDDLSTGLAENVPAGAEFLRGDVADAATVAEAVADVEVIFHQAALGSVPRSIDDPVSTDSVNVHGTALLLQAARTAGVRRVVFASSSSIYGPTTDLPARETAAPDPRSPYAVSKLAAESYCRVFAGLSLVEAVCLRYFNVYGPRQRADSQYAAVVPLFIEALASGEPPRVEGDGKQSRDFTFVGDTVEANLRAAEAPADLCNGSIYNVAGGQVHSVLELLGAVGDILGVDPDPMFVDARPGDVPHSQADLGAAERDLGFSPTITLDEGLGRTIGWNLEQR